MAKVFCYQPSIPYRFALSVIRILQGKPVAPSLEILCEYEGNQGVLWVQSILDDNGCHEPPFGEIGWWKSKLLGN